MSGVSGGSSERSSASKDHCPPGQLYETADGHPAAIAEEDHEKENALGNDPVFSLANPTSNKHPIPQNQLYEDPEYRTYSPRYAKEDNQPLWSLAQPLPRIIRPGMRLGKAKDGKGDIIATEPVSSWAYMVQNREIKTHFRDRKRQQEEILRRHKHKMALEGQKRR